MSPNAPSPSVLVVGESLMDVVEAGGLVSRHPGGSPMNVAYGLGRLGVPTSFLTFVGRDDDGETIVAHLETAGVTVLPTSVHGGRTGTARAKLDSNGGAGYTFDVHWDLPPTNRLASPTVLHVGSVASFLDPGATKVELLVNSLRHSAIVTYDPNIRPALLVDRAKARARFERFIRLADVVKMSDEDASWLFPRKSLDAVVERVLASGAKLVIITRGPEGSRLASQAARVDVPAVRVHVRDTIGAGDSFMSAVIFKILEPGWLASGPPGADALHELGAWAARASSITVTRVGAAPPSLSELT